MSGLICPQCKKLITKSNYRLIKDHCGHMKCRKCLLQDEYQCQQCLTQHAKHSVLDNERTVFEKIAAKDENVKIIYEDSRVIAMNEVNPVAPTHFIVVPKKKIFNLNYVDLCDKKVLGDLIFTAKNIADEKLPHGYRIIINNGKEGGQSINQLHLHVMGGRQMTWPPG